MECFFEVFRSTYSQKKSLEMMQFAKNAFNFSKEKVRNGNKGFLGLAILSALYLYPDSIGREDSQLRNFLLIDRLNTKPETEIVDFYPKSAEMIKEILLLQNSGYKIFENDGLYSFGRRRK